MQLISVSFDLGAPFAKLKTLVADGREVVLRRVLINLHSDEQRLVDPALARCAD